MGGWAEEEARVASEREEGEGAQMATHPNSLLPSVPGERRRWQGGTSQGGEPS
jgi:hypothetical protein